MHSDCDPETSLSSIEVWRNLDGIPTIIFVFDDGRRQGDGSPRIATENIGGVLVMRGLRFVKVMRALT